MRRLSEDELERIRAYQERRHLFPNGRPDTRTDELRDLGAELEWRARVQLNARRKAEAREKARLDEERRLAKLEEEQRQARIAAARRDAIQRWHGWGNIHSIEEGRR